MLHLRRIRLEAIGHPAARFAPLQLDLVDDTGHPRHTVLWLRNGGGKSSLLNLLFSLLRPGRREFLGTSDEGKDRRLADYVAATDTAHVVAEWGGADDPAPAWVTGMVLEWRDRSRSVDESRLQRLWYAFRPADGRPDALFDAPAGLSLASLPVVADGRRLSLSGCRERLREAAAADPLLELSITATQAEWRGQLERIGLDPEVFRYQLQMNREEGGASALFKRRSRSAGEFVDLLLELAIPPDAPGRVADVYAAYADELADRPRVEREQTFLAGTLRRVTPLAEAVTAHDEAIADLREAAAATAGLAAALTAGAAAQHRLTEQRTAQAEELRQQAERSDAERRRLGDQAAEARRVAAQLRVADAEQAHTGASRVRTEAQQQVAAWRLVEHLLASVRASAAIEGLRAELARIATDAEPLRLERDVAARQLAARLLADEHGLRTDADAADQQVAGADARATELAQEHSAAVAERAQGRGRVQVIAGRRQTWARKRDRLVAAGVLTDGLAPAEALSDAEEQLTAVEAERAELAAEGQAARTAMTGAEEARAAAGQAVEHRRGIALRTAAAVHELEQAAEALATDPRVLVVAEVTDAESVEVFDAGPALAARLDVLAEQADGRALAEELAAAADRRAMHGLDTDGLLPPRGDVADALAALDEAGIAAVAGWHYLAENVRPQDRELVIQAIPALVDGVVVLDPEVLARARAVLVDRDLRPGSAVVLGPSLALHEDAPAERDRLVVVPPAPALHDRVAGEEEADRRRERLTGVDERTSAARRDRDCDADLARRLRALLDRYPPQERIRLVEAASTAVADVASAEDDQRSAVEAVGQARIRVERIDARQASLADRAAALGAAVPQLRDAVELAAQDSADAAELDRLDARQRELDTVIPHLAEQEQQQRTLALQQREVAAGRRAAAERVADRRVRQALPDPQGTEVPAEDADRLEDRFLLLNDRYADAVTDQTLEQRLRAAEHDLAEAREIVDAAPDDVRADAARLSDLADAQDVRRRRHAVEEAEASAAAAVGVEAVAHDRVRQARDLLTSLPAGRGPLPRDPVDAAGADALAEELAAAALEASTTSTDLSKRATTAVEVAGQAEVLGRDLRSGAARLQDLLDHLPQVAAVEGVEAVDGPVFDGSREEAEAQVAAVRGRLGQARDAEASLAEQAGGLVVDLQRFARDRRFDDLDGPLRDRLGHDDPADLQARAGAYTDDLALRLTQCEQRLEVLAEHRDLLVHEIAGTVEQALHVLRQAEKLSELPGGFGQWSGQRFLHIRYDESAKREEELFGRLSAMVDQMVDDGQRPEGLPLLQHAVHAAAGPAGFRVSILKPNPALRADRTDVAELATFSGGEQLTAAILLYCTLVLLRGRGRGRGRREGGGMLVLDNPIGKSSNVTLLELQRRVADAMGVQLLYTTAVDDRDAVAVLPHWIRLRNDRVDRHSGSQHVELDHLGDAEAESTVQAARIWRRE